MQARLEEQLCIASGKALHSAGYFSRSGSAWHERADLNYYDTDVGVSVSASVG
jgi:hypothetical protein